MRISDLIDPGDVEESGGVLNRPVAGLSYDSRKVKKGDLFFAVAGLNTDGHEFAPQALERGAAAVVVERRVPLPQKATWVRVRSVRRAMGRSAARFYAHPGRGMVVVGVTGTNGKTTVTYLLESIFSAAGLACGVIGTINYRFQGRIHPAPHTTPESVELQALMAEMARAGVQWLGMEVSSHALAMDRVRGVDFDGAVFTNLTRDHLDFHGDFESYFCAKASLFTDYLPGSSKIRRFAVIHGADPRGGELLEKAAGAGLETISYGIGPEWDIHPLEFDSDLDGLRGRVRVKGQTLDVSSGLIGAANLENILAAVGVGLGLRLPMAGIARGIARLESVPGRMERIKNGLGLSVLVDYAHTPDALERVLPSLRSLTRGRLIVLFGCGGDRDQGKRPIMGEIAARLGDLVVVTSDNPRTEEPLAIIRDIEAGIQKAGRHRRRNAGPDARGQSRETDNGYWIEPDRRASIRLALRLARPGDLVLVAGKGHEDYQIMGAERIRFDDRGVLGEEMERLEGMERSALSEP